MTARSLLSGLVLVALVTLAAAFDVVLGRSATDMDAEPTASPPSGQMVAVAGALTSTWFCPIVYLDSAGLNTAGVSTGGLTAEVVLENITGSQIRASVELRVSNRPTQVIDALVGPFGSETLPLEGVAFESDQFISATVEATSGGLMVTRRFTGDTGRDVANCSSVVTDRWFVAAGDTQRDATNLLVLFNPLPREAIVNVSFGTELEVGALRPQELRGLVVPGASSLVVDVGQHVRRRDLAAAHIEALAGRIVVDHVTTYDGSAGRRGLSVELAAVETATDWLVHVPAIGSARRQMIGVLNPTDEVAEVRVQLVADQVGLDGAPVPLTSATAGVIDTASAAVAGGDAMAVNVAPIREAAGAPEVTDADGLLTVYVPEDVAVTAHVSVINAAEVVVANEVIYGRADDPARASTENASAETTSPATVAGGTSVAPASAAPGRNRWVIALPQSSASEAYVTVHVAPTATLDAQASEAPAAPREVEAAMLLVDGRATATFAPRPDAPVTLRVPTGSARIIVATEPVVVSTTVLDELPSVWVAAPLGY